MVLASILVLQAQELTAWKTQQKMSGLRKEFFLKKVIIQT